jgi:NAD+ kinase
MADEYEVEKRMMLHGTGFSPDGIVGSARALNDIVITRKGSLQIIHFNIYVKTPSKKDKICLIVIRRTMTPL